MQHSKSEREKITIYLFNMFKFNLKNTTNNYDIPIINNLSTFNVIKKYLNSYSVVASKTDKKNFLKHIK